MIRVERERKDATRINALLNDPRVRPWIANGNDAVDVTGQVSNQRNVFLVGDHGACMFLWLGGGIYEAHTAVLPEYRGEWTDHLTEVAVNYMFTATDCFEIATRVPYGHIGARTAAIKRGMRYEMTRPDECLFMGKHRDVHIYSFRIQDWIVGADHLEEMGRKFHDALHRGAERLGIKDEAHGDDPNHNKYVGAAIAMVRQGQVRKGVTFYNRWAVLCRHAQIALLQEMPYPVIRIDHGLKVSLKDEEIGVSKYD